MSKPVVCPVCGEVVDIVVYRALKWDGDDFVEVTPGDIEDHLVHVTCACGFDVLYEYPNKMPITAEQIQEDINELYHNEMEPQGAMQWNFTWTYDDYAP